MQTRSDAIAVDGGAVPTEVLQPGNESPSGALVVVPSIYGAAPDLLERLAEFADRALVAVPDPFWRTRGGVVPYAHGQVRGGRDTTPQVARELALADVAEPCFLSSQRRLSAPAVWFGALNRATRWEP